MAEPSTQNTNHWQSIGSTLGNEHLLVSHLRPSQGANTLNLSSLQDSNQYNPHASGASLNRQSSVRKNSTAAGLRRGGSVKRSPADKLNKFVNRLSWNQRSKTYVFGKAYLQRQPSFVVTPDRSSYSYGFKNRELVKRKPRPQANRTSQPIAAWKNPRPMDVLMNQGKVDIPPFLAQSRHAENKENSGPSSSTTHPKQQSSTLAHHDHHQGTFLDRSPSSARPDTDEPPSDPINEQQKRNLVKISLPVKHNRTSSNSNNDTNQTTASTTTSTPPTASSTRTHRSSYLNAIPQTPIATSRRRAAGEAREFGDEDESEEIHEPPVPSVALLNDIEPISTGSPQEHRTNRYRSGATSSPVTATPEPRSSSARALAQTIATPPQSPTSLPSSYRPESWRRSAIIARNSLNAMVTDDFVDSGTADAEFVGTWSTYIRKAVAQRAIDAKQRKSWELNNELRWSRNLEWESEPEFDYSDQGRSSSEDYSSVNSSSSSREYSDSHSDGSSMHSNSSSDRGSSSSGGGNTTPRSTTLNTLPERSTPSVTSRTSSDDQDSIQRSPRAITEESTIAPLMQTASESPKRRSASKLAPLNSPREMASASATALAEYKRNSLREALVDVPQRYTSLFAGDATQWQPESNGDTNSSHMSTASTSSSSRLNEDEYIFPPVDNDFTLVHTETSHDDASTSNEYSDMPSGNRSEIENNGERRLSAQHAFMPSDPISAIDFDFNDQRSLSRKRPLPLSPVNTPPQSPRAGSTHESEVESTQPLDLKTPVLGKHDVNSALSLESTPNADITEGAPAIVRSQSQWKKKPPTQKRIRSSTSREVLVHARQKTMESMWGEEDESDTST